MRFTVHIPDAPIDPRSRNFDSLMAFEAAAPATAGVSNLFEHDAARVVRLRWRNALCMPIPVKLGSGTTFMLGVLPTVRGGVDRDAEIPFVAFVRPIAESDLERKRMGPAMYDQDTWRVPLDEVAASTGVEMCKIELRTTDFPLPHIIEAGVGHNADGELVIAVDVGEGRMSMTFLEPEAFLEYARTARKEPDGSVSAIPDTLRLDLDVNKTYRLPPNWHASLDDAAMTALVTARDWYSNGLEYEDRPGVVASFHPLIHKTDWPHIVNVARELAVKMKRWVWLTCGEDRWARISFEENVVSDQYITSFSPSGEERFVGCS